MTWFCNGCGERRGGTMCKRRCREKYGDVGAERVPPLAGIVFFNCDGTGVTRDELRRQGRAASPSRIVLRRVQGPRPNGWDQALSLIATRAAERIRNGVHVAEC